jgi:hypothetical protein
MLGRRKRNTLVLGLLAFILAAIGIMEVAIITAIATFIIIIVIVLIGMDIAIMAAVKGIMAADMDITAEARRCRPSDLTRRCRLDERLAHSPAPSSSRRCLAGRYPASRALR